MKKTQTEQQMKEFILQTARDWDRIFEHWWYAEAIGFRDIQDWLRYRWN
jgi:hypothetical protein